MKERWKKKSFKYMKYDILKIMLSRKIQVSVKWEGKGLLFNFEMFRLTTDAKRHPLMNPEMLTISYA